MTDPVVQIRNMNYSAGGVPILENIDLTINAGDYLAVIGPNGGGKSSLLKVMLGLVKANSGEISVLGKSPGDCGGCIGYLPQHTHVAGSFPVSVLEAVCMGLVQPGMGGIAGFSSSRDDKEKARNALERVDMLQYENRNVAGLSGGQKQRVFIARALADNPELLILDEPTASVDSASRNALFQLLNELNKDMTIIMVSHDISSLASGVKSVACVNRALHYHPAPQVTQDMYELSYGTPGQKNCPVELVTHGHLPHRVLGAHDPDCDCEHGCAHRHNKDS